MSNDCGGRKMLKIDFTKVKPKETTSKKKTVKKSKVSKSKTR